MVRPLRMNFSDVVYHVTGVGARCGTIAFIDQPKVIETTLTHLGLWPSPFHSPPGSPVTLRLARAPSQRDQLR